MGKASRRQAKLERKMAGPQVHVKVVHAAGDLRTASRLVKPALLYADKVTIYSPGAWMLRSVDELASLSDPLEQVSMVLDLVQQVPELSPDLQIDSSTIEQLRMFLKLDPAVARRIAKTVGGGSEIDSIYEHFDQLRQSWAEEMPATVAAITDSVGGNDLLVAVRAGAVEVADITSATTSGVVADSVKAALGTSPASSASHADEMVEAFMAQAIQIVFDPASFPLLDAQTSGLIRTLEQTMSVQASPAAMRRGAEVDAAARFMGYLPYFPELPMDEVLDLRRTVQGALSRFRGEMVSISEEFESRPVDEGFEGEVENAWRSRVEPALTDIREALAEHGLLGEVASVVLGDPKRLLLEDGGVLVAAHGDLLSLSKLMTIGATAGTPTVDVLGRAISKAREARKVTRKHAFYFLHRVREESASRT